MKISIKFLTLILTLLIMIIPTATIYASEEVYTLQPVPPALNDEEGISVYGAKPPTSGADVHNLSVSTYSYQVEEIGAAVYTSKWLTGASSIHVSVENWALLVSNPGATNNKLTVSVYDSNKSFVASTSITIDSRFLVGSGDIDGLDSSKKYYVRFSVPTNGNKYSFNGDIYSN